MIYVEEAATALFEMFGNIMLAFIRKMAPFAVPLAPAFFFMHAVWAAVLGLTGSGWAAGVVAGVAGLGLESVGILSAHIAVKLYRRREIGRTWLTAGITLFYVSAGIITIWVLESTTWDVKAVGTLMFLLSLAVYLLIGLNDDMQTAEQAERLERERLAAQEAAKAQEEQAERAADKELARQLKLERARAKAELAKASIEQMESKRVPAESQHESYQCEDCGQGFGTVQALNAHGRWCKAKSAVYLNGDGEGE